VSRRSTRTMSAAVVAVALLATAACGGRVGENGRIGVVYLNAEGYYAGVERGISDVLGADGAGPQLLETNIRSDASRESSFINTMSSAGVDALIVSPASETASIPAVQLAQESGVPVICYNTCLEDRAAREYVQAFVLGSPEQFGRVSGEQMGQHFLDLGIPDPKIGIINCESLEVCITRREGFEAALRERVPGAQVVANQQGLLVDEAVERAEQVLTAHPDLDAFYGEAGSMTVGAVRAVQSRGKVGQVVVFGGDMSTQVAEMLQDGTVLKGMADISGITVGTLAARAAEQVLAGQPPAEFLIPAPVDAYLGPEDGARWLREHADGIP
jgi:sugar transport system substrate-binding protein